MCVCCHVDCDLAKVLLLISLASRWYPGIRSGTGPFKLLKRNIEVSFDFI